MLCIISLHYQFILLRFYYITLSYYIITLLYYYTIILLYYYTIILLYYYIIILLPGLGISHDYCSQTTDYDYCSLVKAVTIVMTI